VSASPTTVRFGALVAASLLVLSGLVGLDELAAPQQANGAAPPLTQPLTGAAPAPASGGSTAAALWLRDPSLSTAAPLALLHDAGIPAVVTKDPAAALSHSLAIVWPASDLSANELSLARRFAKAGGLLLAVGADPATSSALGPRTALELARFATSADPGSPRDQQIALLRKLFEASPAGFHLGDAPGGAARAVALVAGDSQGTPLAEVGPDAAAAGGSFPLWSGSDAAPRFPLRFPVAASAPPGDTTAVAAALVAASARRAATGAPTVLDLGPDDGSLGSAVRAGLPSDVWVGTLPQLATFWRDRSSLSLDAEPHAGGWKVVLRTPATATSQTLVAPRAVRSATAGGTSLRVLGGRRVVLPAFQGELDVQVQLAP
jgi:hypothetical protein